MLSRERLEAAARAAPGFADVARGFRYGETYDGVVMFAPVIGNPNVSVMRELHDTERALRLVVRQEAARGWRYDRLVFSRLEFRWVAPHPPLSALDERLVWVPSGQNIKGVNDRHAVMPRHAADAYFNRWTLLTSPGLLTVMPRAALQHMGPEEFLLRALEHNGGRGRIRVGFFPAVAYLDCCRAGAHARCFNNECHGIWSAASCADRECLVKQAQRGETRAGCEAEMEAPRVAPTASLA
eukprot:705790-Prymnesium_polylepis.1